jgi:DNA-binding MarR family transcriptional regulator
MISDQSDPRQLAWRALFEAYGEVFGRLVAQLNDEAGMPVTTYDVLLHLDDAGGRRRMTDLAQACVISKSGLTSVVDRLEADGLVERVVPPGDRRSVEVVMTQAGRRRFEEARRIHRRGIEQWFVDRITVEEGRLLLEVLGRLRDGAEPGPGA